MAKKLLLTAFKPYENYARNVSAEVLRALTERFANASAGQNEGPIVSGPPRGFHTGLYDVDFDRIPEYLARDLTPEIGAVILMGQAPGRLTIDLERFAINAGVEPAPNGAGNTSNGDYWFPLEADGPAGVRSDLPLDEWVQLLKEQGFPMKQSFHAGTYLCNASLFHALRNFQRRGLPGAAVFLHLPLATELFSEQPVTVPMKTILKAAEATIQLALEWIDEQERAAGVI